MVASRCLEAREAAAEYPGCLYAGRIAVLSAGHGRGSGGALVTFLAE